MSHQWQQKNEQCGTLMILHGMITIILIQYDYVSYCRNVLISTQYVILKKSHDTHKQPNLS